MPIGLSAGVTRLLPPRSQRWWRRYARETRRPTHVLVFLLPLLLVHEIAVAVSMVRSGPGSSLIAYGMIQEILGWIGLVGGLLPGLLYVAILIAWRQLKRDTARAHLAVVGMMVAESVTLAVPLLVWSALFTPLAHPLGGRFVLAVGAGLYEELVFRFLLITGLTWVAVYPLRLPPRGASYAAVVVAALLFAACHFRPIGADAFGWALLLFRIAAGVYLAAVYLARGLGISAGAHVAHNLVLSLFAGSSPP